MIDLNNFPYNQIAFKRIDNFENRHTIVFLHDSLGCIDLWRDFPEKLGAKTNFNILIYDRQGYGKSCKFTYKNRDLDYLEIEADILNELMKIWQINDAILFGHSDGGSIALITAAKYPSRIRAIITEGAHIFREEITLNGINEVAKFYENTNLKQKLQKYHGDKTDDMFKAWAETWNLDKFANWNIEHFLPYIKCKTLIIQGENDEFGTMNQVEQIYKQTSGPAHKFIVKDASHTPHKEYPELLIEKVKEFVEEE